MMRNPYLLPISFLDLPDESREVATTLHLETVGDCLDFFLRLPDAMLAVRKEAWDSVTHHIKPALMARGYWPPAEFVLYNVSIDVLDLSPNVKGVLRDANIYTVGECVRFLTHGEDNTTLSGGIVQTMFTVVLQELIAKGYWEPMSSK